MDHALRFDQALDQAVFLDLGAGRNDRLQAFENFVHRLQEFLLFGVAFGKPGVNVCQVSVLNRHVTTTPLYKFRHRFYVSTFAAA